MAANVGSPGILAELVSGLATHLNVDSYAKIVKEKSILRHLQQASIETVQEIADDPSDVDGILNRAESRLIKVSINTLGGDVEPYADSVHGVFNQVFQWSRENRPVTGITSGFSKLDDLTTGWAGGDSIIIGARPGVGKTALMLANARAVLKQGIPVHFFSLEMTKQQLILRLAAMEANVSLQAMRKGGCSSDDLANLQFCKNEIAKWPFTIDDESRMDMRKIRSRARKVKMQKGTDFIQIDYMGLIKPIKRLQNRHEEVSEISAEIKDLAKELNVPIQTAAQLNRKTDGAPILSDLKESGSIEQDADHVLFLHRNPEELESVGQNVPYHLILAKQRNGPTGTIKAFYSSWRALFKESKDD
jgi:replicative DNA helicase